MLKSALIALRRVAAVDILSRRFVDLGQLRWCRGLRARPPGFSSEQNDESERSASG
jgi:hypothetical protein